MTTKSDIKNKIKNLVQYKNKTPEELDTIAEEMLEKEKEAQELSSIVWIGLSKKEKEKATEKYKQYREKYNISKLSDTEDLKTLIQTEIIIERIQEKIGAEERIPKKGIIDSLTSLQRQVNELKARLGLHTEDKKNDFDIIQLLKKKYRKWMDENQLSRETKCIAKGSKVLMSDFSVKNIENIKVGDKILGLKTKKHGGHKLVKQKVKKFYNQGKKEILEITTKKGRKLRCTVDHLIFCRLRAQDSKSSHRTYIRAEDTLRRHFQDFNYIENKDEYYKGALLGFIESDGWDCKNKDKKNPHWNFTKSYNISQSAQGEIKALEFLLNYFQLNYTKKIEESGYGGKNCYSFYIKTKHTIFIDKIKEQLFKNKNIAFGFLAGFVLGDGSIDFNGNIDIFQKNKIDLLKKVFKYLNLFYSECNNKNGNGLKTFGLRAQFPIIIPKAKKGKTFLKKLFNNYKNCFAEDKIVKLELLKEKEYVFDLTTETQNFIVNGIPVHNCPNCSKVFLLRMRTDKWESQKHPFLKDNILCNEHLLKLYKEDKITKEDVANVLGCGVFYVDWMLEKLEEKENVT